ncbi:MAG TPA: 2'-deoxycytidine 5'-triphosphate deaminase, partial [Stellaceae bacterium]
MSDAVIPSLLADSPSAGHRTGILPFQHIHNMLRERQIAAAQEILPDQVQPASLDLRLGNVAYRVRASFLPGAGMSVMDKIKQLDAYPID